MNSFLKASFAALMLTIAACQQPPNNNPQGNSAGGGGSGAVSQVAYKGPYGPVEDDSSLVFSSGTQSYMDRPETFIAGTWVGRCYTDPHYAYYPYGMRSGSFRTFYTFDPSRNSFSYKIKEYQDTLCDDT